MAKQSSYNMRNPGVKRIFQELRELEANPSPMFTAACSEEDIFDWHFTVRGPPDSEYAGGLYHGRLTLPPEYPFKPPSIVLLTPNGRFELGTKICLSISNHHPELWQPWSIRIMLNALINFFPTKSEGAIGGVDHPADHRRALAARSHHWKCDKCGKTNIEMLPPMAEGEAEESPALPEGVSMYEEVGGTAGSPAPAPASQPSPPSANLASPPPSNAPNEVEVPPPPVPSEPAPRAEEPVAQGRFVIPGEDAEPTEEPMPRRDAPLHAAAAALEERRRSSSAAQQSSGESLDYAVWAVIAMIVALVSRKVLVMNGVL